MAFINTEGMSEISVEMSNIKAFQKSRSISTHSSAFRRPSGTPRISGKTGGGNKSAAAGVSAAIRGDTDASEKVGGAIESLDAAIYGDRTELITPCRPRLWRPFNQLFRQLTFGRRILMQTLAGV